MVVYVVWEAMLTPIGMVSWVTAHKALQGLVNWRALKDHAEMCAHRRSRSRQRV